MAYQLVQDALRVTRLTAAQKLVLVHLCDVANAEHGHEVWHSQTMIAHCQGISERTAKAALKELAKLRLVKVSLALLCFFL